MLGKRVTGRRIDMQSLAMGANAKPQQRMVTGIAEFDRVSGGGLVRGSASLIGGDPGSESQPCCCNWYVSWPRLVCAPPISPVRNPPIR